MKYEVYVYKSGSVMDYNGKNKNKKDSQRLKEG